MSDNIACKKSLPYLQVRSCLFRILPLNHKGERNASAQGPLISRRYNGDDEKQNSRRAVVRQSVYSRCSSITMKMRRTSESKMMEATKLKPSEKYSSLALNRELTQRKIEIKL